MKAYQHDAQTLQVTQTGFILLRSFIWKHIIYRWFCLFSIFCCTCYKDNKNILIKICGSVVLLNTCFQIRFLGFRISGRAVPSPMNHLCISGDLCLIARTESFKCSELKDQHLNTETKSTQVHVLSYFQSGAIHALIHQVQ